MDLPITSVALQPPVWWLQKEDQRTPADLLDIIERNQKEIATLIQVLRQE